MRLMREIRFSLGPSTSGPVTNSWAGWPSATGVQPYLVLQAVVEGEPDPITGYLCNIKLIDDVVRTRAIPLTRRLADESPLTGERLIRAIGHELLGHAPESTRWVQWRIHLTPYLSYTFPAGDDAMIKMTQSFEFAAAHRLHCDTLSEKENRSVFGKCNNPNGHGHNYQVEITIEGEPNKETGLVFPVPRFEQIVGRRVIDHFDHKHLNADCEEFTATNPSVENITRTIWNMLDNQFAPARLAAVRVYETPKTWAEFTGT